MIAQKELLFISVTIIMLYKRAFRKEKEVITFLRIGYNQIVPSYSPSFVLIIFIR